MTEMDKKRRQLELARVRLARQELEFKIEERMEEIARIQEHIQAQINRETELENELKGSR